MVESYILLGISIIFVSFFLVCRSARKSCFCLMGTIICFGLLGHLLGAHYFGYIVIFLGLATSVLLLAFELMLVGDDKSLVAKKDGIASGVVIFIIYGALYLIFKKNKNYFHSQFGEAKVIENIFEINKGKLFFAYRLDDDFNICEFGLY